MKTVLKRLVCFVCLFATIAAMFPANVAEAATKKTIKKGQTVKVTVGWNGDTIKVTLKGITNTARCEGHPSWVTVKKDGYCTFTLTVKRRANIKTDGYWPGYASTKNRSGDIVFREGSKVYTIRITELPNPYNILCYQGLLAGFTIYHLKQKYGW